MQTSDCSYEDWKIPSSTLPNTILQNFPKLICCFAQQSQVITETKVEFPNFLGKPEISSDRNRKHKNISQESTNCLESLACVWRCSRGAQGTGSSVQSAAHTDSEAGVCTLRYFPGSTELNEIWGNILGICPDLEYQLGSPPVSWFSNIVEQRTPFLYEGNLI